MTLPVTNEGEAPPPAPQGRLAVLREWWGPNPRSQFAVILGIAAILFWAGSNIFEAMTRAGITPGFGFLGNAANFQIGETPIRFSAGDSYLRAILVGLVNTLRVAITGCLLAAILGVSLGILSLSGSLLLAGLVRAWIELIRNTPLLLQLFFWIAVARSLPGPREALGGGGFHLTNRGVFLPSVGVEDPAAFWVCPVILVFALLSARQRRSAGKARWPIWVSTVGLLGLVLLATGPELHRPELRGSNFRGGLSLSPEYAALLTGLSVKFSAYLAEIVRAGILSVPHGQREAARALGLSERQILRLVVLPQALRVIVPLSTSAFLDLAKDSSLAVAIGYPDIVSILNTTANTTGQAIEAVLIMAGTFLGLNLVMSWVLNRYNRRVALRGDRR